MKRTRIYQRKYIVNRELQLNILLYSLLLAAWVSFANFFCQSILLGTIRILNGISTYITIPVGLFIVFSTSLLFGLVFTNRIAGPIFRLRQHMEEIAEGKDAADMEFRKDDYFSDIIAPYNKILNRLRGNKKS